MLGDWAKSDARLDELKLAFTTAAPYPHVVIDDFFAESVASNLEANFPKPRSGGSAAEWRTEGWHVYDNPIEGKLAKNDVKDMPVFAFLQSNEVVALVKRITDIPDLENDPHLHGAGVHYHPSGGRLEMHLDYSIHPVSGKERRVNLIVYLNRDWDEAWAGHLQLWEGTKDGLTQLAKKVAPKFNRAVIMQTSDVSWHGLPDQVACPADQARKSIAIYYVSEPRPEAQQRMKASFRPRPDADSQDIESAPGYLELCKIRDTRLLTQEDVHAHMPGWSARWL